MLLATSCLKAFRLKTKDSSYFSIDNAIFNQVTRKIEYIGVNYFSGSEYYKIFMPTDLIRGINPQMKTLFVEMNVKELVSLCGHKKVRTAEEALEEEFKGRGGVAMPFWSLHDMFGLAPIVEDGSREIVHHEAKNKPSSASPFWFLETLLSFEATSIDAEIGPIQDFIVDTNTMQVQDVVVKTGGWWRGFSILIPGAWFDKVDWPEGQIRFHMKENMVGGLRKFIPNKAVNKYQRPVMYDYYGRPQKAG